MGNCLKTQLKEVVNNDNLDFLGALRIPLSAYNSIGLFQITKPDSTGKFLILGNGVFCNQDGTETYGKEINNTYKFYIKGAQNGDYLISLDKYSMTAIYSNTSSILRSSEKINFDFCNNLREINLLGSLCTIELNKVSLYAKDLAELVLSYNNNVDGDIETIVENILKLGRNTGTLSVKGYNTKIRLNGVNFFTVYSDRTETMTITFGNNSATCTWKGNTVASYNGSTWTYSS